MMVIDQVYLANTEQDEEEQQEEEQLAEAYRLHRQTVGLPPEPWLKDRRMPLNRYVQSLCHLVY